MSIKSPEILGKYLHVKPKEATRAGKIGHTNAARAQRAFAKGCKADEANDEQTAERCYRRALFLQPGFPEAANNLARLLARLGRMDEAEVLLRKILRSDPTFAAAQANLAMVLYDKDHYEEAIAALDAAYKHRKALGDQLTDLYRLASMIVLLVGVEAVSARDLRRSDTAVGEFVELKKRAKRDGAERIIAEAVDVARSQLVPKELQPALEDFLVGVKLMAIEDPWEAWDALAEEISKVWPKDVSAVDAIREQRD